MTIPRLALWLPLLLVVASACQCGTPIIPVAECEGILNVQPGFTGTCTADDQCADHYGCKPLKEKPQVQCCTFEDRRCNTEADCCPGQTCPSERKKCFDRYVECESDDDCGEANDRFCEPWVDAYGATKRCVHRACSALGECAEGQSCFQGDCIAQLPCDGTCPSGEACVPATDRCQKYGCAVSCQPGFLATFKDARNIWDTCELSAVGCACAELPPLRSEDLGRHSAIAVDPEQRMVYASHYDGQFGDLVVNRYGQDGKLARQDYVDGVPLGAAVKHGPSGARGGIVEPGPDVGRYSDIATFGSVVYVSYYDATAGDLKLAVRQGEGLWKKFAVDGAVADLGLYTSLAVDSDGFPVIAYFQRGGADDFDVATCPTPRPTGEKKYITALKLARATAANPNGPSDFAIHTLACQSRSAPACEGCAGTCADTGTGAACHPSSDACPSCDPNTEACVLIGTTPTCAQKYNPSELNELPDGVGLFASVATSGKDAVVVYMRRQGGKGRLEGVRMAANGGISAPLVLDASGDTGWYPEVKFDPTSSGLAIAYHDFSSRQLRFLSGPDLAPGMTPEVIDTGVSAPGSGDSAWVGQDASLAFSPSGALLVAYQDGTRADLKIASRTTGWEVLQAMRTEGAVGFFADAAFLDNTLFITHARLKARHVNGQIRLDNVLLLDRYNVP